MTLLKRIYDTVGTISEWSGRIVSVAVPVLIVTICYDVLRRYLFNSPTVWSFELSYMLGTAIIALGLPYVHYHSSHVRVDVVYSRLSARGKLILDIVLTIALFFPLAVIWTRIFGANTWQSFVTGEISYDSMWYPHLWPFKLVVTIGFFLLLIQGAATFMRDILALMRGGEQPW